jgi:hypothetical protein
MELSVGQEIPVFTRTAGFSTWNRYAAVNNEFVYFHMDDDAARAAGYPDGAFGMGNLQISWLHAMLREWVDPSKGRIIKISCQLRGLSLKDRVVQAKGVITEVRTGDGGTEVDLDIWSEDDSETRLAQGKATVALPNS